MRAFHPLPIPLPSRERGLVQRTGISVIVNLMAVLPEGEGELIGLAEDHH